MRPTSVLSRLDVRTVRTLATPAQRDVVDRAMRQILDAAGRPVEPGSRQSTVDHFHALLESAEPSLVWLAISVLETELATPSQVRRAVRAIRLDGVGRAMAPHVARAAHPVLAGRGPRPDVRVEATAVLVDVDHTARTGLATGIQRVARETVARWTRDHPDVRLVGWDPSYRRLRLLEDDECVRAVTGSGAGRAATGSTAIVPWGATYLLPELSPERDRNERIAAIAQFSRSRTGVIGFDCVPISTAETTVMGASEAFATNLAAVRHMDRISTISRAAAVEYGGWRSMLSSVGSEGPLITTELLPAEAASTTPERVADIRRELVIPGVPMVLCVGTHEPRKNHLALLHASELLWREGVNFSLVLVGGRSWNDDRFQDAVSAALARNRPVQTVRTLSDDGLWAAYRAARCMVFPSLNEGFGLPVAEALACGTPVITSNYGSMAEIGADGGALLVDPRDDQAIASALHTMLTDDETHARLVAEAAARPRKSWDDYAAGVWSALTT